MACGTPPGMNDQLGEEHRLIVKLYCGDALEFVLRVRIAGRSDRGNPIFGKVAIARLGFISELIENATAEIATPDSVLWEFENLFLYFTSEHPEKL